MGTFSLSCVSQPSAGAAPLLLLLLFLLLPARTQTKTRPRPALENPCAPLLEVPETLLPCHLSWITACVTAAVRDSRWPSLQSSHLLPVTSGSPWFSFHSWFVPSCWFLPPSLQPSKLSHPFPHEKLSTIPENRFLLSTVKRKKKERKSFRL